MLAVMLAVAILAAAQTPQPFPAPGASRPAAPAPASPGRAAARRRRRSRRRPPLRPPPPEAAPTEVMLGVPIYPGAQFIASYDAGRGQRYYIFGSSATFVDLVTYYRNALKQKGELVYEVPATHEFDVGTVRRRPDGVSARRDDQGLPVGRVAGLPESETGWPAGPVPDRHPDRPGPEVASAFRRWSLKPRYTGRYGCST